MNQTEFRTALLDPGRPAPAGLTDPDGRPPGRRFDVYRNNVAVGLVEALRQSFPVVRKLVGEDFFTAMAREHLRAHPPSSPLLMFYGEAMPAFLHAFPPVAHLGYLPDVARLELALRHSYHAADAAAVPPERLQSLDPVRLMSAGVSLAPAVRLVRSRWPIHAIWMANMRGAEPPRAADPQDVLVMRRDFDPEPALLPDGAGDFIARLMDGQSLGAAAEAAGPFEMTATLTLLLRGGCITDLTESYTP
jgi:hypothetical protein